MEKRNITVTIRERNTPFSFCKILSYNVKSPYNHKVLHIVKHALFVAIEALPHYHHKIRKTGYNTGKNGLNVWQGQPSNTSIGRKN